MSFDILEHDAFFGATGVTDDSPLCRNWTQGAQNGLACTYNTPLAAWSGGVLTPAVATYIDRLRDRWKARIAERDLNDPNLNFIATNSAGLSLPDAQHFCVRPLVDAVRMFERDSAAIECGKIALSILQAYFIQAKVPYFRDGGKGPFGYSGRTRIAGWGIAGYADAIKLFSVFNASRSQWDFLLNQITRYFTIIKNAYPLIDLPDGPDGDHANLIHVCVFNGGILARGLISLADNLKILPLVGLPEADVAPIYQLAARICEEMACAFDPDRQGFYYDLPYEDGKPMSLEKIRATGAGVQRAAGETNVWCAAPFTIYVDRRLGQNAAVSTALDWQRQKAVIAGFFDKPHPVESVKSYEGWMP